MIIEMIFPMVVELCKLLLFMSMVVVGIRLVRGPYAADRVVALDMLCLLGIGAAALVAVSTESIAVIDVVLGIALIGFLATVAFAAFIVRDAHEPGE